MTQLIRIFFYLTLFVSCQGMQKINQDKVLKVLPFEDVKWELLNPARGGKSPKAATLWGDRKKQVPTAFLVQFVDGFSSPPHIHNVSYRGIVINGLVHNDHPSAITMGMPPLSYWTQPAGETHITSAKGKNNIAFIEIDKGPYLVHPVGKAFSNGEKPINVHASNIIWHKNPNFKQAYLWANKEGEVTGSLIRFSEHIRIKSQKAFFVIIQGTIKLNFSSQAHFKLLSPGSFFTIPTARKEHITCQSAKDCVLYIKSDTGFTIL